MLRFFVIVASMLLLLCGCSGRLPALKPPKFDPQGAAAAAMEQYDSNSDGRIGKSELASAPGISAALGRFDADEDGAVSAEEISTLIQDKWLNGDTGVMRVAVDVRLNRKPLGGAMVTFEPEQFLGDVIHPATGETDGNGYTPISMAAEHMPHPNVRSGVTPGLYLVRISKEVNGKEVVPAKYNSDTTLAIEIASRTFGPGPVRFDLRK